MTASSSADLRAVSKETGRLQKAEQYRLNEALAAVRAAQATHTAEKTDASRMALSQALDAHKTAKVRFAEAKQQAETAKTALSAKVAARPHRAHKTAMDDVERTETVLAGNSYVATITAFADGNYSDPFPAPPAAPCGKTACLKGKASRALEACPCNIKAAFADCDAKELKMYKAVFANDNFNETVDQAKAEEVRNGLNSALQEHVRNSSLTNLAIKGKNKHIQQSSRKRGDMGIGTKR